MDSVKIDDYLFENLLTDPLDCAIVEAVHRPATRCFLSVLCVTAVPS